MDTSQILVIIGRKKLFIKSSGSYFQTFSKTLEILVSPENFITQKWSMILFLRYTYRHFSLIHAFTFKHYMYRNMLWWICSVFWLWWFIHGCIHMSKNDQIVYFKYVQYIVFQLYPNNAFFKNPQRKFTAGVWFPTTVNLSHQCICILAVVLFSLQPLIYFKSPNSFLKCLITHSYSESMFRKINIQ